MGPPPARRPVADGLPAEHEQGITIDVACRFFTTPKRSFILAPRATAFDGRSSPDVADRAA